MNKNFFSKFNFFKKDFFGFDISDDSIKYIEILDSKNGPKIGRHGEINIPSGVVHDGKILEPKKLEEIISSLKKKLKIKLARVSLPEEQAYLFKIKLDKNHTKNNIRKSIELHIEEYIHIDIEDIIFDYKVIDEDKHSVDVAVSAISRDTVESYSSVFTNSQIKVDSFQIESQSIKNTLIKKDDQNSYMIVDVGIRRTAIFIVANGFVNFSTLLKIGDLSFLDSIKRELEISTEEAENIKNKYGLHKNIEKNETFSILVNEISVLCDEVIKHFSNWHSILDEEGKKRVPIKKIILSGAGSNLKGFSEYLSLTTRHNVEVADVWINIHDKEIKIPEINFEKSLSFAKAIGLCVQDSKTINLSLYKKI